MGVLANGSKRARPSVRPSIDMSEQFSVHVSANSKTVYPHLASIAQLELGKAQPGFYLYTIIRFVEEKVFDK